MGKTIKSESYCTHIVPKLEKFWHQVSQTANDYVYIQQDGAFPYRSAFTTNIYKEKGLYNYLLPWAACSPDANLIECVWRLMKTRINRRIPRPQTNEQMRRAILEEWERINEDDLGALLLGMPERVATISSASGGHTRF